MYGMPLSQTFVLLAGVLFVVATTQWRPFHPFLVLVVVAAAFGAIAGYPTAQLGSLFGSGFSEKIYAPGLVIVAASLIAGIADSSGAAERLTATIEGWRPHRPRLGTWIAGFLGLVAGMGASASIAFALLTPLLRPIGGADTSRRQRATVTLALSISASHGLLVLTPVPIAAMAILGADWHRVALFGVPLALLLVIFSAAFAGRLTVAALSEPQAAAPSPATGNASRRSVIVLLLAIALPLLLLMEQSIGDIPSEPLGGGPVRELMIGVGRPLILFLVGTGIMVIGQPRLGLKLAADSAWTGRVFGGVASTLLVVCAAGGLQRLCQQTGMAELFGERVAGLASRSGRHRGAVPDRCHHQDPARLLAGRRHRDRRHGAIDPAAARARRP